MFTEKYEECLEKMMIVERKKENLGLYSDEWMKLGNFLCGYPQVKAQEMKAAKDTMLIHRKILTEKRRGKDWHLRT